MAWVTGHSRVPEPPARMMPLRAISGLLSEPFEAVVAVEDALGPPGVGQVPVDRGGDAILEAHCRGPAQFVADLAGVDRVAAIVAGAVADELDLAGARLAVGARAALVQQAADGFHDLDVLAFG